MDTKELITPIATPGGLDPHVDANHIPEYFDRSVMRLIQHIGGFVDGIMVGGTTGEGHNLTLPQYRAMLRTVKEHAGPKRLLAAVLGRDEEVARQVQIGLEEGYGDFVLAFGHTGDPETRVKNMRSSLGMNGRGLLYNMPCFPPMTLDFAKRVLDDEKFIGIKSSSGDAAYIDGLLELKEKDHPGITVYHGNEGMYGDMPEDSQAKIDGLISGTSNPFPQLLRHFLDKSEEYRDERAHIGGVFGTALSGANMTSVGGGIHNYIRHIKTWLWRMGIFSDQGSNFLMYSDPDKFFVEK